MTKRMKSRRSEARIFSDGMTGDAQRGQRRRTTETSKAYRKAVNILADGDERWFGFAVGFFGPIMAVLAAVALCEAVGI